MESPDKSGTSVKVAESYMLDIFHRDPAMWEKYRDEANLLEYGTADLERIRIAIKDYNRRTRRWTFNGTHWFGKPWP